jgi:signal transduction histidine kinase/CheY-like chemotaxis protein
VRSSLDLPGKPESELTPERPSRESVPAEEVFAGGGEMGSLMRAYDWSRHPLGPPQSWSPALQSTTRLLLANCTPMLLWWGPDFFSIYNDAYIPVLGDKHPHRALGRPLSECWSEVFPVLEPLVRTPLEGGPPTWMEDIQLEINRFGFVEETHFTVGYSPVPDSSVAGGIGGVLATVHEITEKVLAERRVVVLRDLGTRPAEAQSAEEACSAAAATLARHAKDIPFAAIYLVESNGERARLAAQTGTPKSETPKNETEDSDALHPGLVDLTRPPSDIWSLAACKQAEKMNVVRDLRNKIDRLPVEPWSDPPHMAAVVPIMSNIAHRLSGFLVAGISPRLRFDDAYRGFLDLASAQIATAIANARAIEEERRRVASMAEIDRAKTTFFTNISHEFRTPLTLMMAPLEDALAAPEPLPALRREGLEVAYRNSLRLLKLVNTLLDFSRIEAGRMQAVFEPLDLAVLTGQLASVFRSAVERAGLKLIVDCPPLPESVYVDREMWEKIVLNLISNAFKYTLEGEVAVTLRPVGKEVELSVRDTGSGISSSDLPHIFERFYRARNTRNRSHEGSGIGLALVHDLVKLNGGAIRLESRPGAGSTFTVSIPFGSAHLPREQVGNARIGAPRESASSAIGAEAFVREASRWTLDELPRQAVLSAVSTADPASRACIVLAEDNADMRDYLQQLLGGAYRMRCFADGQAALQAVLHDPPDLVLTDVMMPGLDGFGLLKALRDNAQARPIPVILLSARAGEESRLEGISAGADDYLVKPFSAREILARVENQLALSRIRREAEQRVSASEERFRALVSASSDVIFRMSPDWREMWQLQGRDFVANTHAPSGGWLEKYIHPDDRALVWDAIQKAIRDKSPVQLEHRVLCVDGSPGWTFSRAVPLLNPDGEIVEWFGAATDITARKQSEQALLRSEKLASIGRMAATIAHEINNPLESVTNLLFLADHTEDLPDSVHRLLKMADAELQRVAHIARQSLGFYRESNAPALTSVNALLDSAIDMLKSKINEKQAIIERDWRDDVKITAVAGELRQVFSNLLANSLDAIDLRGRIRIRVSASMPARQRHAKRGARTVRITFCDDGRGIQPAIRSHIFEPFFTTKGAVGTGLGLWVSKQIVDKHGGAIGVRSRSTGIAKGTAFSVVLPVDAAPSLASR